MSPPTPKPAAQPATQPAPRPRKDPSRRSPIFQAPPAARGRVALGLAAGAAQGRLLLQACGACGRVQYPPREACGDCLHPQLHWQPQDGGGELLAETTLQHSNDLYFRAHLPWRLGLVRLDAGPSAIVHLHGRVGPAPARVRVTARLDRAGQAVLVALPDPWEPEMADDPMLQQLGCSPRQRRVLVTDALGPVGQALVPALLKAGAAQVWAGVSQPWRRPEGARLQQQLQATPGVTVVPLDTGDERAVHTLAAQIGHQVEILVHTHQLHHAHGLFSRPGTDAARAEMEVNCFGLMRLAQAFGPVMRARAADGVPGGLAPAVAWVNLLSVFALSPWPAHGSFSTSMAAADALARTLRAEMLGAGIRVLNVYPGPIDDEATQALPPPKLAPQALAGAIVQALADGVEEIWPGEVAQDWLARWRDNPHALARELAAGRL